MAEHKLTADGSTPWFRVHSPDVHISLDDDFVGGTFGSGTVALEKRRGGLPVPVYDYDGVTSTAIVFTEALDTVISFKDQDVIRLTMSGSTNPDLIAGLMSKGLQVTNLT